MPENLPRPNVIHYNHISPPLKQKVMIIGDVHGCFDELQELLGQYSDIDTSLVFVGDLVTKGPKSVEVVKFVRGEVERNGALCVRGNHDDAALARAFQLKSNNNGKYDYIQGLSNDDIRWLRELPYTISIPQINAIIVHAGIVPGIDVSSQQPVNCSRMRNLIGCDSTSTNESQRLTAKDVRWEVSDKAKKGVPWASQWRGPQHVYFGHDSKRGIQLYEFATGIDTGCCYGGQLTAIILPEKRLVQVHAKLTYKSHDK